MSIKDIVCKFNYEISKFAKRKSEFCNCPGRDFSRNRKQNFEIVIRSILSLNGGTLTNELLKIHQFSPDSPSASAFIQQRAKLSENAFPYLFQELNSTFDRDCRYDGYRLIAVDGSHIHVPNNPEDKDSFVQSRADEHFHNEFHLNAFWDIMQGTFLDAVVQKYRNQNEDRALIEMLERSSPADMILVCDRGYEAYNNIAHIQQADHKYVMRIKEQGSFGIADGLELPDKDEFDMYTELSLTRKGSFEIKTLAKRYKNKYRWLPSHVHFDYLPPSKKNESAVFFILKFRILRIKIKENQYEMLLTNLPSDKFPPHKLKEIYSMRWGIETSFRDLKYIVGMLKFHSKKSCFVTQEIYAALIMHNMTVVVSQCVEIHQRKRKYEYKIRFSNAVCIVKSLLTGGVSPPAAEMLIRKNLSPIRPNRGYPRKKTPLKAKIQFVYRIA